MNETGYSIVHPDEFSLYSEIMWSKPYPYEVLYTGHAEEDYEASFYSIVAYSEKEWWSYYIGMVYEQCISDRHKQEDHKRRLKYLQSKNKNLNFSISLGTLKLLHGARITKKVVDEIEGLLIYGNWNEYMVNKKKIEHFSSDRTFHITNKGFIEHLESEELAYGVFQRNT